MRRKYLTVALVLMVLIAVVAVAVLTSRPPAAGDRAIRIAAVLPLTGPAAHIGEWQRNGIELALDEVRHKTTKGAPLQVVYEDSGGVAKMGVTAFLKLADTASPTLAISSLSSVSNAILPHGDQRQIPLVMIACSYPGIAARSPWAFRCNPGSEDEARAIAEFLLAQTQMRKVAVF
jgi:branched-chain amino acid transport system substrate-binding protein